MADRRSRISTGRITTADAPPPADPDPASHAMEARLRALHDFIPEAALDPEFVGSYVDFVRALRERLHPRGMTKIRRVAIGQDAVVQVDLGDRLGADFYYGYVHERFEAAAFVAALGPGAVVLDVGANFGYYSVLAAQRVRRGGAIHAFEPDPAAYRLLAENARLNGLEDTLRCHAVVIGAEDGETPFYIAEESAFSGITPTGRAEVREVLNLPVRSLDAFLGELGIETIDALKIDVEGAEAGVLDGARETIRRSPDPLIMLEVTTKNLDERGHDDLTVVLRDLYEQGYSGWIVDVGSTGLRQVETAEQATDLISANLFLARAGSNREARLREACAGRAAVMAGGSSATESAVVDSAGGDEASTAPIPNLDPSLVQAALRARDRSIGTLRADLAQMHERLTAVQAETDERQQELKTLEERLAAVQAESDERQQEIRRLQERLATVEADSEQRQQEIRRLQDRLAAVGADSDQRLRAKRALEERLAQVRDESEQRLRNSRSLEKRLLEVQAESEERLAAIRELEAIRTKLLDRLQAEQARSAAWQREAGRGISGKLARRLSEIARANDRR